MNTVPNSAVPVESSEPTAEQAQQPLVVLVDDDDGHRHLLRRWIEVAGYRVADYASGPALLDALGQVMPDALLLDLHMDDMDGFQVLRHVKARLPDLPVYMLTGDHEVKNVVQAMQLGAENYITKPVRRAAVLGAVKSATEKSQMSVRIKQLERQAAGRTPAGIVGSCASMRAVFDQIDRVACADITVLVTGESGTGKELVARAIHQQSSRSTGPFVALNCAAIAETLQESELFGHERGSFTGAQQRRRGHFEMANGGTLFLDEVGELPLSLQAKLLRVLQERRFYRIGGTEEVPVDVRVVAATHRDLAEDVQARRFRQDLFFRLAVFELELPPLRDRGGDLMLIADKFRVTMAERHGAPVRPFSPSAEALLVTYAWPGNVRELQNAIERAVIAASGECIEATDFPSRLASRSGMPAVGPVRLTLVGGEPAPVSHAGAPPPGPVDHGVGRPFAAVPDRDPRGWPGEGVRRGPSRMQQLEREAILAALDRHDGNVSAVVRDLGIPRTTLYRKLKKLGLR